MKTIARCNRGNLRLLRDYIAWNRKNRFKLLHDFERRLLAECYREIIDRNPGAMKHFPRIVLAVHRIIDL